MVTLAFFIISVLLSIIITFFDTVIFGYSFWESYLNLFYTEIAVGKYIVFTGAFFGFLISMIIDLRMYLTKRKIGENQR
ncbi:hypothetical protein ACQYAD_06805 [Neobacillus sp. SM06]|uniref:hypothetical protein n=1 Tax=Neobacillus sp. SM06 TaxID=3422492 RepID=UPI003D2A5218